MFVQELWIVQDTSIFGLRHAADSWCEWYWSEIGVGQSGTPALKHKKIQKLRTQAKIH